MLHNEGKKVTIHLKVIKYERLHNEGKINMLLKKDVDNIEF